MTTKRTFRPNNRRRAKTHGFRKRMSARAGRAVLAARRRRVAPSSLLNAPCSEPTARRKRISLRFPLQDSRTANRFVVIHTLSGDSEADLKVGFTVSKKVGNAVVRNKVRRRLRHIMRTHLHDVDAQVIVIRALPARPVLPTAN